MDQAKQPELGSDRIASGCKALTLIAKRCSHRATSRCPTPKRLDIARRLQFTRPPKSPPWLCAGVLAILEHLRSVHEHVLHSDGILVRLFEGRLVGDRFRIEDDNVSEHSFLKQPALIETKVLSRQAGHLPDCLFQRDHLFFTDILSQDAREISVGAWVAV